jgi:YggT family protein
VLLYTLIDIITYLIQIVQVVVIVQFVMYLLITFNVVNMHNHFVESVWRALNAILDPILSPIRRIMPNTGGIDFSPMVLIIGLVVLQKLLWGVAMSSVQAQVLQ